MLLLKLTLRPEANSRIISLSAIKVVMFAEATTAVSSAYWNARIESFISGEMPRGNDLLIVIIICWNKSVAKLNKKGER